MMSSYVCRQCRNRLIPRVPHLQTPQWHQRATFISFLKRDPPTEPVETATQDPKGEEGKQKEHNAQGSAGDLANPPIRIRKQPVRRPVTAEQGPVGRYSRLVPEDENPHLVEDSFPVEDTLKRPEDFVAAHAVDIEKFLEDKKLAYAWTVFNKTYRKKGCRPLTHPAYEDVPLIASGKIFEKLLSDFTFHFGRGATLPASPTTILLRLHLLGVLRHTYWSTAIQSLTIALLQKGSIKTDSDKVRAEAILAELLSVWRLFIQCNGVRELEVEALAEDWNFLPSIDEMSDKYRVFQDFAMRLQTFHPQCLGNSSLAFSAITIFQVFNERSKHPLSISESLRTANEPFLNVITHCLAGATLRGLMKWLDKQKIPGKFYAQLETASSDALAMVGSGGVDGSAISREDQSGNLEDFMLKRIARAVQESSRTNELGRLWREAIRNYTEKQKTTIPSTIYDSFLTGFLVLSQADQSVAVWNHMIANGVKPGVRSYQAMLLGCAKTNDIDGINQIWRKMMRAGILPDNFCWTTRINALMSRFRHINDGFAALDEMGKTWLAAEKAIQEAKGNSKKSKLKLENPHVKPSVEVINAAISAMASITHGTFPYVKKAEAINKVLNWGGHFKLRPDAITYNTLLNLYLSGGQPKTALKLLAQMESEGIEPDIATFALLIRAGFERLEGLTHDQQADKIMSHFRTLEAGGLKLNDYIYSTAVDRLLKLYGNFTAVRQIMDHMMEKGIVATAHIYTPIVTHYFQSTPPDIEAVDALVHQIFTTKGTPTNRMLFDRIIQGYANAGEVGRMMAFVTRVSALGVMPGWQALITVVRALVAEGDLERVKQVVADVRVAEEEVKTMPKGGEQKRMEFWRLVMWAQREGAAGFAGFAGVEGQGEIGENAARQDDIERWIKKGPVGIEFGEGAVWDEGERDEEEEGEGTAFDEGEKEALEAALGWSDTR
ncbi:hypothetical protein P154DRAFT_498702 [Amniculicola lignicola CBS 123094]|uniref:Pentatricopeptide repeat protein n=1 Tax=Amniculicola lignicola CBS 123094 TaxID=1392246 RepID=A0A6A5W4Z9_9PLEO|nr:hypothetical protein P154DRAFT_498702 [Amniculicola lignicola CBS 123094]